MSAAEQVKSTKKYWLIIGLFALVIGAITLEPLFRGDDEAPSKSGPQTPVVTESPGGSTAGPTLTVADQEAAQETAAQGIQAYTQYSWKDPRYDSWITRLKKVSTANFIESLRGQFQGGPAAVSDWKFDVVDQKRETRTTVDEAALLYVGDGEFAGTDQHDEFDDTTAAATFVVSYTTSVRDIYNTEWTDPIETLYLEVTVVKVTTGGLKCAAATSSGCLWRINGIRETTQSGGNA